MPSKGTSFVKKFFWEGQALQDEAILKDPVQDFLDKYRKYVAVAVPFVLVQILWWLTAFRFDWFPLFPEKWPICIMMMFGALIGGMTSEGGGAVAFPVMTLLLKILPRVARDFSLIIQSVGLTSASFSILYMNIQIEKTAILLACVGSVPGFVFGSHFIDPFLNPNEKKMLFVSIWGSFAIALFTLNQSDHSRVRQKVHLGTAGAPVLIFAGFAGGCFTSFAGSGVDIAVFSVLTLFFRVSEKIATPTTVVLMAINSMVGFYYRAVWETNIVPEAWDYVKVAIPVVVFFAPLGSFLGSHFHRKTLAGLIYLLEFLAVIGFVITNPPKELLVIGGSLMFFSFFFFRWVTHVGKKRFLKNESKEMAALAVI